MRIDKRTRGRELAIQALYQLDVQGSDLLDRLRWEFFGEIEQDARTRHLAWEWTNGTWTHIAACDELIVAATIRWQFSRLSPVDKSILRLAVYQLKCCPDIPPKVVINEFVDIAKAFFPDGKEPKFVNAVLDHMAREAKPEAF